MKVTIAGARVSAGYTQQELADKMGVSRSTVIAWEKGKASMRIKHFYDFCKITGFNETDIILPVTTT